MYHVLRFYISDRMAENMKEKQKQLEVKEEIVSIQEKVEDTCTVYKEEEDAQMEFTETKGKHQFQILLNFTMYWGVGTNEPVLNKILD